MSDPSGRLILPAVEKYLDARQAADRLGATLFPDDWSVAAIEALDDDPDEGDNPARERAEFVESELRRLLVYGAVTGYFEDDECAIRPLGRATGKPWFAIDIERARVRIWHDEWARLFFDGPELAAAIDRAKPLNPRQRIVYRWENIVFEVWRHVVERKGECTQAKIVEHVKTWHNARYHSEPDYKELNALAKKVLAAYRAATSGKL